LGVTGTAIIIWHDGKSRYDEVTWDPTPIDETQALKIAIHTLGQDRRATRVHVEYSESAFIEAVRDYRGH
jgi:hypothetical protein